MPRTTPITVAALVLLAGPFLLAASSPAQEDTVEDLASGAEAAAVARTLDRIGCEAATVERESASLFEVDDATCAIGQYDIKPDGRFNIISMTRDE